MTTTANGRCEQLSEVAPRRRHGCPWIMGIINVTPDSFSDGSRHLNAADAANASREFASCGVEIIDIGAESTAPGRKPINAAEEWSRLEPVLTSIDVDCLISIDTFKAAVAEKALSHGARMINDVSALRADPDLTAVVREHRAFVVLMFSKEAGDRPHCTVDPQEYPDLLATIEDFLDERIEHCLSHGIAEEQIILDPGMGHFISSLAGYSWELLANLDRLVSRFAAFPILIGTSRKGFLGGDVAERDPLSQLTALAAHLKGARIIRTHNPQQAIAFFEGWGRMKMGGGG